MTRYSQTSIDRRIDWDKNKGVIKREVKKESTPNRNAGPCMYCGEPVFVSPGQIISYYIMANGEKAHAHKKCRKNYHK